jgi:hypothetical protein
MARPSGILSAVKADASEWLRRRPLALVAGCWLLVVALLPVAAATWSVTFPTWLAWLLVVIFDGIVLFFPALARTRGSDPRLDGAVIGLAFAPVPVALLGIMIGGLPVWALLLAGCVGTAVVVMGSRSSRSHPSTSPGSGL